MWVAVPKMASVETIMNARQIGLNADLRYVYCGNIPGQGGEDTLCWECDVTLIERQGFAIRRNTVQSGKCPPYQDPVVGVGI